MHPPRKVNFTEVDAQPAFFRDAPIAPTPALQGVSAPRSSGGSSLNLSSSSSGGGEAAKRGAGGGAAVAASGSGGSGAAGRGVCAASGSAAKYVDPATGLPFADLAAFQAIRNAAGLPTKPARRL
jgi:hypothetical protein